MRVALRWRRTAEMTCHEASAELPLVLEEGLPASGPLVDHVETCLGCQAELARYRRLLRLLHQLRTPDMELPSGLVAEVLGAIEQAANRRVVRSLLTGRRAAYAGAAVGAVGATAGLVMLARSHARTAQLDGRTGA